jgi:large subunit ribosomal protein L31
MQEAIHPRLVRTTVTCSTCGAGFETRSTASELRVDVCSKCHPAYTGRVSQVLGGSQVERFARRWGHALARPSRA